MGQCFVIQPFDNDEFDRRYDEVIAPAITTAGLSPYRVDRDPKAENLIDDIEANIRGSTVCLADITLDNPNVWYELGYSIAANKSPVLLCNRDRKLFPFDIQHRSVIRYSTKSPRDFVELQEQIIARLQSYLHKQETYSTISSNATIASVEGLSQPELITLAAIAENFTSNDDPIPSQDIKRDAEGAGFTRMAVVIGLKSLLAKGFIFEKKWTDDDFGQSYTGYILSPDGWDWILDNQNKFVIRGPKKDEDIPF